MSVPTPNLELLSLDLEYETGYDSIPTIERVYDGECVFPDCEFRTRNAHCSTSDASGIGEHS